MAFTVEDGTGVANANSYAAVADADAYFADRGNAVWSAISTDAEKEQALVKATDYIETMYARRFVGEMAEIDQALSWPREDAVDRLNREYTATEIPEDLKRAAYEYAVRASQGDLIRDAVYDANGFQSLVTKEVVGPIEQEFRVPGMGINRPDKIRSYPSADKLVTVLLRYGGGGAIR